MRRLVPTGDCWCGCGAAVDLGSFFAPGHDKKAESRLIMEVFGGVPQMLVAFGRVPGIEPAKQDPSWLDAALRLVALDKRGGSERWVRLEHVDINDRYGRLVRTEQDHVELQRAELVDGQATFGVIVRGHKTPVNIPFVDVQAVFGQLNDRTVRVAGALDYSGPHAKYVSFSSAIPARGPYLSYQEAASRFRQLGAAFTRTKDPKRPGEVRVMLELGPLRMALDVAESELEEVYLPRLVAMLERGLGRS